VKTNKGIIQRFVNFEAAKHPPVTTENFGELYEQHRPEILRFCLSMLRNYECAEELAKKLAETTSRKASLRLAEYNDKRDSLRTWIFKIARDVCFDELYSRHYPEIFRFCLDRLKDHVDVEDIVQDAFVKAYLTFNENKGASFRTWVYRIAEQKCIDESKKHRWRRRPTEVAAPITADAVPLPDAETPSAEQTVSPDDESYDIRRLVNECLDQLDEREKTPFVLHRSEGLTYEEIAEIIRTSLGTARNRVKSAEVKMKVCLEKKGAEDYL